MNGIVKAVFTMIPVFLFAAGQIHAECPGTVSSFSPGEWNGWSICAILVNTQSVNAVDVAEVHGTDGTETRRFKIVKESDGREKILLATFLTAKSLGLPIRVLIGSADQLLWAKF